MFIIRLNKDQFVDAFKKSSRKDQFSTEGLEAIYDYFEYFEEDTELNYIDLCCEFAEYADREEMLEDYPEDNADIVADLPSGGFLVQQ